MLNLCIASNRFNKPIGEIWRATLPFLVWRLLALLLITYVSAISLAPLRWLTGGGP